jgi:copper chaperone CopZ
MQPLQLTIDGMSCGHCLARVEKALSRLEGVVPGKVLLGHAELLFDPSRITPDQIVAAIDDAGYGAQVAAPPGALA